MTKGKSKAKIRRRLRKRGAGNSTKMLGRLTRYNYGIGPKVKNHRDGVFAAIHEVSEAITER